MTSSPPKAPSSSLLELLAQERSELLHAPAAPRRALSSRRATMSPPPCSEEEGRTGDEDGRRAVGTVVAMLSGYAGQFTKDAGFRRGLREKCAACLVPVAAAAQRDAGGHAVLDNLELGIESIERLADAAAADAPSPRDAKIHSLRNSIRH